MRGIGRPLRLRRLHLHRWVWQPVTYSGGSSLLQPADVDAAVMDWNNAQGRVPLTAQVGAPNDLQISDKPLNQQYIYGLTTVFGMTCNSICLNKIATCNGVSLGCANSSAFYYVTVNLDTNQITNLANGLSLAGFSTSTSELADMTLRHELGHALSLGHPFIQTRTCSATQSILMGNSGSINAVCGVTVPNTSCDGASVNQLYSSMPGYCDPTAPDSCSGTCQ